MTLHDTRHSTNKKVALGDFDLSRDFHTIGEGKRELSTDLLHAMQALSQLSHTPLRGMAEHSAEIKKAAHGDFDYLVTSALLVEVSGIEPLTSCMPCKRSPS